MSKESAKADLEKVFKHIDRDALVKIACDLVDIPSPSGYEKSCADYILSRYKAARIKIIDQQFEDQRSNAIGVIKGRGNGPTLMLNGHMDTYCGWRVAHPDHAYPRCLLLGRDRLPSIPQSDPAFGCAIHLDGYARSARVLLHGDRRCRANRGARRLGLSDHEFAASSAD